MRLQAYKDYKTTNAEWLGDVPKHWNTKRLKMSAGLKDRKVEAEPDDPLPYIGLEDIESWTGRLLPIDDTVVPAGTANAFEKKHTLFGKLRPYLAKACNPEFDGLCSTELLVLQPVELDRRNLLYSLLSDGFINLVDSSTFGSKMPRASWEFIGNCVVPIPPPDEQRAIADFLDRETARLDMLVGKKRELIEKLKEKRTAVISRTVTRGLNPKGKLKPSGIEWLGNIPEHWETRALKRISDVITVGVVVNPSSYVTDEGVPFLLGGDIREFRIDTTNCNYCAPESSEGPLRKSRLSGGDVVVVRVGYPGVAALVPEKLSGANCASMMLVRSHKRFCSQWLAYIFNSQAGRDQVEIVQYGAAQKQFNISHAVDFQFPFPPLPEQSAIADYLDRERTKIDRMMEKVEAAIEKLQEYRTALITAAVTGKIDVRAVDR